MTHGRTRWVRRKRQTGQEAEGAELSINTNVLLDLVITGAVSAVVSTAVNQALQ